MKMISRLSAILFFGSIFFASCSHKDAPGTTTPPPSPALSVDKTTLTQAATAATATITITSNVSWKVTSSSTWAIVSPATGSNNGKVTVTMAASEGTTVRTADITVAPSESGSSLTPQVIKITQIGSDPGITSFSPTTMSYSDHTTDIVIKGHFRTDITPTVLISGRSATVTAHNESSITLKLPFDTFSDGKIFVSFNGDNYETSADLTITNRWNLIAPTAFGLQYILGVSFVLDGKIFIGLGDDGSGKGRSDFQIFNIATKSFSPGPTLPSAMKGRMFPSCFVINNIAYIGFGTSDGSDALNDWWSYNPTNNTWTPLANYPVAGVAGLGFANNNIGYAGVPTEDGGSISQFDPLGNGGNGSWTSVITSPLLKLQVASSFTIGNDAYILGGIDLTQTNTNKLFRITPGTASAPVSLASLPPGAIPKLSFSIGGYGYAICRDRNTYKYDPVANNWTNLMTTAIGPVGVYNAVVINGKAYVIDNQGVYEYIP